MKLVFSCIFVFPSQKEIDKTKLFPEHFNVNVLLGGLTGQ